jgi:hypothetical protein
MSVSTCVRTHFICEVQLIFQCERTLVHVLLCEGLSISLVSSVLFIDEARFSRDGINIPNKHQWAEENPHHVVCSRHWQQFSINVLAGTVSDFWYACMFCYIRLQATTTEITSYMIRQSYSKMYHWQTA